MRARALVKCTLRINTPGSGSGSFEDRIGRHVTAGQPTAARTEFTVARTSANELTVTFVPPIAVAGGVVDATSALLTEPF